MVLSRDEICNALDLKTVEAHIDEWGGNVRFQELSGIDRSELQRYIEELKGNEHLSIRSICIWLVYSIVNSEGEKLFQVKDTGVFEEMSYKTLIDIFNKHIVPLNGLITEQDEASKKNSELMCGSISSTH